MAKILSISLERAARRKKRHFAKPALLLRSAKHTEKVPSVKVARKKDAPESEARVRAIECFYF